MFKKVWPVAIILMLCLLNFAHADQKAYISKVNAFRASKIIQAKGDLIRFYCAPCGDEYWEEVSIDSVKVRDTGYENYWEVAINGAAIDLAYTYVKEDGSWRNLAMNMNLDVVDVPEFIDDALSPYDDEEIDVDFSPEELLIMQEERYRIADGELNAAYGERMKNLAEHRKAYLRDAQRAWIKFRDTRADFAASGEADEMMRQLTHIATLAEMTEKRTNELRGNYVFSDPDGENICPDAITTIDIRECLNGYYQAADAELNDVYQQIVARLSQDRATTLKLAQRAWIPFRDACADYEASEYEGGTMGGIVHIDELRLRTHERVGQLKEILIYLPEAKRQK